jgi:hypothetical protein
MRCSSSLKNPARSSLVRIPRAMRCAINSKKISRFCIARQSTGKILERGQARFLEILEQSLEDVHGQQELVEFVLLRFTHGPPRVRMVPHTITMIARDAMMPYSAIVRQLRARSTRANVKPANT